LESIPPSVDAAKVGASNLIPVSLSVGKTWNSKVLGLSANGESSLGDPDGFVSDSALGSSQRGVEQALSIRDAVCHCILEIWVCIHSDEAAVANDQVEVRISRLSPANC
jgi:hypothetical protein